MDLTAILKSRVDSLPAGDHAQGLKSVYGHVVVAARHLERGQSTRDDTAFTDAIYRANQAFEGSLKEAYRVLAGKNPTTVRPLDIETYLLEQAVLRPRVVDEFTNYRKQWRNPSTHDYSLDFDDDEALLAIVSVCAFAIVLIDQIAETLAFRAAEAATRSNPPSDPGGSLAARTTEMLAVFPQSPYAVHLSGGGSREGEIIGALAGYLSSALGVRVTSEVRVGSDQLLVADLVLEDDADGLVIEVKRGQATAARTEQAVAQLARYLDASRFSKGVVYFHPDTLGHPIIKEEFSLLGGGEAVLLYSAQ